MQTTMRTKGLEVRTRLPRRNEGGVLVFSLVAVLAVSVLAASLLQMANAVTSRSGHAVDAKQAFYVAEAGLAEAYIGLGVAKTGNVGTAENPAAFGEGLFWVEATELGDGLVQLESTGMWGAGRSTLGLVVERQEVNPASLGVFSAQSIEVHPESLIDSFDSTAGSYASQVASGANNFSATMGSNSSITIVGGSKGAEVRGDVTPGVGEPVVQSGTVTISGSTASRPAAETLPPPQNPDIPLHGAHHHKGALPMVVPAGENGFETLHVGSGSEVIVVGPGSLRVGDLILDSDAKLTFDVAAGSVDTFVTESMVLHSGASVVNTLDDPTRVTIQVSSATRGANNVQCNSSTSFYGSIYAPESEVTLSSGFEVFGSVVAHKVSLSSKARLHVDLGLSSADSNLPRLFSWRVVDMPNAVAAKGLDPFHALGVTKSDLRAPAQAHLDQRLVIDYLNGSGVPSTYDGWESGFDWSDVRAVVTATRDGTAFAAPAVPAPPPPPPPSPPPGTPADWIADPTISSSDLLGFLLGAGSLGTLSINDAIKRDPPMDPDDLMELLQANYPLGGGALSKVAADSPLSSKQQLSVFLAHSPIKSSDLKMVTLDSTMDDADLRDFLIANSPIGNKGFKDLDDRVPPMNQADYDLVLAAQ